MFCRVIIKHYLGVVVLVDIRFSFVGVAVLVGIHFLFVGVAQLVEHSTHKAKVTGSIPVVDTNFVFYHKFVF